MKNRLKKITVVDAKKIITDKDVFCNIKFEREPFFKINQTHQSEKCNCDPLLDIEIALSRCSRVGLFGK